MKKKEWWGHDFAPLKKILLRMRLTALLIMVGFLQVYGTGFSQNTKFNLDLKNKTIRAVLSEIEKNSDYRFFYSVNLVNLDEVTSISVNDRKINEVLDLLFEGLPITYEILENDLIALKPTFSQQETPVSGKVTDNKGQPIPGVTILLKGTTVGTVSNLDGFFSLNVPSPAEGKTIIFSFVGMKTQEVEVGTNRIINITMVQDILELEEVIATGYQTISRERITGSADRVNSAVIAKRPVANLSNALNGQIAGMVSDPSVGFIIRGRGTLSSNTNDRRPLLVVDGFPIEGGFESINPNDVKSIDVLKDAASTSIYGARAANGVIVITTKGTGAKDRMNISVNSFLSIGSKMDIDYYMNMASPADHIAFEELLYNTYKDVSGNPFFGNPYGVITFSYRRSEYITLLMERDLGYVTQEYVDEQKNKFLNGNYRDDFDKYILRNALSHQQNIIISGSGDKNSYKFSVLYDNDKSYVQRYNNDKVMLGFTNIYKITKNIKYTFNTNLTFYKTANNSANLGYAKNVVTPWQKLYDEYGNYTRMYHPSYYEPRAKAFEWRLPYHLRYNLLEESHLRDNLFTGNDLRIQNLFEINLAKNFKIQPMFQYEKYSYDNRSIYDERSFTVRNTASIISELIPGQSVYYRSFIPAGGFYKYNGGIDRSSLKFRIQADYNKIFAEKHELVAIGGWEVISTTSDSPMQYLLYGYRKETNNAALFDYATQKMNIWNQSAASGPNSENENFGPNSFSRQATRFNERFIAGFFNSSYTFDKKYTVSVSLRTDASNFISRNMREKFSPFYSFGLRWNMKGESFMKNASFVNMLALRITYGATGNAAGKSSLVPYSVFATSTPGAETGNLVAGSISGRLNDKLTWEKTYSTNIATDFSLFNNKLNGSIDAYRRYSKDLLTLVQQSNVIMSTTSQTINAAELLNKGIEISLGTDVNLTRDLNWTGSLNFDYNFNEVKKYKYYVTDLAYYLTGGFFVEGLPTDQMMTFKLVGTTRDGQYVFQTKTGELIIENSSANSFSYGSIGRAIPGVNAKDDDRIYYVGRSTPPATMGFTNSFKWKGFTLMTVVTGRYGHYVRRGDVLLLYSGGASSFSKTGLALLQSPSEVATTSTGHVYPNLINRTTLVNSTYSRAFYSDAAHEKASHIRFDEIYLGYDFQRSNLGRLGNVFKNATVYGQARNLGLIWTNNESKVDPVYLPGSVKPIRTFTFGIRVDI